MPADETGDGQGRANRLPSAGDEQPPDRERSTHLRKRGTAHHLGPARRRWLIHRLPWRYVGALWRQVEQLRDELGAGRGVQGAVMHLGDQANLVTSETGDDVQLPERELAVQRLGGDQA